MPPVCTASVRSALLRLYATRPPKVYLADYGIYFLVYERMKTLWSSILGVAEGDVGVGEITSNQSNL